MPLIEVDGARVLVLSGSPYEMGVQHGRLLQAEVRLAVHDYLGHSGEYFEVPREHLERETNRCLPFIPGEYLEEIRGISDSSGVAFQDLLTLNCMIDIDNVYTHQLAHCCNFILAPPVAETGRIFHGRNLDFPHHGILQKTSIVVARRPASGVIPTIGVAWAGFVGMLTGYNVQQLSASEVTSPASDNAPEGMPITMIIRKALESAPSVADFYAVVKASTRTSGYNMAVCDGKTGEAVAIEMTRSTCRRRMTRKGILVVDTVRLCSHKGAIALSCPAGAFRHARLMQLLGARARALDEQACLAMLSDRYDLARGRERGKGYFCLCNDNTVQSVLFMPAERRMLVSHGHVPAPEGRYAEIFPDAYW